jgi:hypothetical protein
MQIAKCFIRRNLVAELCNLKFFQDSRCVFPLHDGFDLRDDFRIFGGYIARLGEIGRQVVEFQFPIRTACCPV